MSHIDISFPDWVVSIALTYSNGAWTCTAIGDQYRTGTPHTATRTDTNIQYAINGAVNTAGNVQERAVAMGRETADAIDEVPA